MPHPDYLVSLRLTPQEILDLRRDAQESHRLMAELLRAGRQSRPGEGYNYKSLPKNRAKR